MQRVTAGELFLALHFNHPGKIYVQCEAAAAGQILHKAAQGYVARTVKDLEAVQSVKRASSLADSRPIRWWSGK